MNALKIVEHQNQRVLLTSQLAESYGTTTDVITRNFNRNKERYQEGKHFYSLEGEEKTTFLNQMCIRDRNTTIIQYVSHVIYGAQ